MAAIFLLLQIMELSVELQNQTQSIPSNQTLQLAQKQLKLPLNRLKFQVPAKATLSVVIP